MRIKIFLNFLLLSVFSAYAQNPWNGIIPSARATNWTYAGIPGDIPPSISGGWTQSGSTITACGTSGSPVSSSSCGITAALNACGTNHYIGLGSGNFYLNTNIQIPSNCTLRGAGPNLTMLHFANGGSYSCNGGVSSICFGTSDFFAGYCSLSTPQWPCPAADYVNAAPGNANWTSNYSQGSTTIILDNVTGIVTTASSNPTPIILDQCDVGYTGNGSNPVCSAITSGAGAVTAVTIYSGGSAYAVNDTGILNCSINFGLCYGENNATYQVTSVSAGVVTGLNITAGGSGYTYSSTASTPYVTTTHTSGSGTGLQLSITGIVGYDNNSIFACAITMVCTYLSSADNSRPVRTEQEVVMATSISGSGPYTVTLSHPIIAPDWTSGRSPKAYWGAGSSVITNAGVENVLLDQSAITTGASAVTVDYGYKIWVYQVASNTANIFHVTLDNVSNILIANSYFYGTLNHSTTSYGIGCQGACAVSLFENNIEQQIVDSEVPAGPCAGCVFGYNFALNPYDTASSVLFSTSTQHAGGTNYILTEGDIGTSIYQDNSHGPHFMDTYFRNFMPGMGLNNGSIPSQATIPVTVGAFSRYNNYLGNVLGTTGYHTVYECLAPSTTQQYCPQDAGTFAGSVHIWDVGYSSQAQRDFTNSPVYTPNDPLTQTSLYRYGNYDIVNNAVQWNSAEVPTTDPNFPVTVPSSVVWGPSHTTTVSSFYNGVTSAFPACHTGLNFWKNPTTGLCPSYPNIGPDVSSGDIGMCTSGTYKWSLALNSSQCGGGTFATSINGGFGTSNPAMRCALNQMGIVPDGVGAIAIFNPSACYEVDTGSSPPSVSAPTGLTVGTPL
jgi:hypothetical protein